MKTRYVLGVVVIIFIAIFLSMNSTTSAQARGIEMTVFKSPTCGCCGIWESYIDRKGFDYIEPSK